MEHKLLQEVAVAEYRWAEAAHGIISDNWEIEEVVREEAELIRDQVVKGSVSMDELRGGVTWANALDRESIEKYGAGLPEGAQAVERTARRVMHLAGRSALNSLKNRNRRLIAHVACNQQRNLVQ